MDLKLDKDLLTAALKKVVGQAEDVTAHDVSVMMRNPVFTAYIIERAKRLAEANDGQQLFAMIATIFHLGMETGITYQELQSDGH